MLAEVTGSWIASLSMTTESPIWSSACATLPSGVGIRKRSSAPNARL